MRNYAVVAYLDSQINNQFTSLWQALSDQNITDYGVRPKGKRPHLTLADYDEIEAEIIEKHFKDVYRDVCPIEIQLSVLGSFIGTGTLFFAPTFSMALRDFHANHHQMFDIEQKLGMSLYSPGNWIPHVTIASRLNEQQMIQAFSYSRSVFQRIEATITEVSLIKVVSNSKGNAMGEVEIISVLLKGLDIKK